MGILAFGGVILDAQSQGAGRHQWDVNVINAIKVAKVWFPSPQAPKHGTIPQEYT